jgi:thymidylate synthase (FAD)
MKSMKVKLIQMTENPIDVMWTAARTCYSAKSPIEIWEDRYGVVSNDYEHTQEWIEQCTDKHWNLVKQVLNSGHQSIAEHVYFTFAIEGISRACSHQLVRHRAGIVFSQQSQRYVEIKESLQELRDIREHNGVAKTAGTVEKYFVSNQDGMSGLKYAELDCLVEYRRLIEEESTAPEDARAILPNATKTNITMSVNFRELIHLCNLRLCTRAQKEIRDLFGLIVKEVKGVDERLASYLVPQCEVLGLCTEHQCCGRKPQLKEVMEGYEKYKGLQK